MNYHGRDKYGMHKRNTGSGPDMRHGRGQALMGAETLVGKVGYAVLSFGPFLRMGEKLFAVPLGALKLESEYKRFVLRVEMDRLKKAPGFVRDKWPKMADPSWVSSIRCRYGTHPPRNSPRA
jgi:hypothetical protein